MMVATKFAKKLIRLAGGAGIPITVTIRSGAGRGLRLHLLNATREHAEGTCEPPVQRCLEEHLRSGSVCLDIGANIGFFSVIAARLVGPHGRVVALEPVPENVRCIRANARINGLKNLEVIQVAAGQADGTGQLHLAEHSGGATMSEKDVPPDAVGVIEVPVVTVDHLVESGKIPAPTFIKIDVEGTEAAVIDGMAAILAKHRPGVVFEVDDRDAARAEAKFEAISRRLVSSGYEVERLGQSYVGIPWSVLHGFARPTGEAKPNTP